MIRRHSARLLFLLPLPKIIDPFLQSKKETFFLVTLVVSALSATPFCFFLSLPFVSSSNDERFVVDRGIDGVAFLTGEASAEDAIIEV